MTFEEWDLEFNCDRLETETTRRGWFNAAREGMIPADQAIKVPGPSNWKKYSEFVVKGKYRHESDDFYYTAILRIVPRPAPVVPKWTPHPTDKVFALGNEITFAGILAEIDFHGEYQYLVQIGERKSWFREIKPFDASKIGMKWEDI